MLFASLAHATQPTTIFPYAGYKVVLIAGDGSLKVFDNAVSALRARLAHGGIAPNRVVRLSGAPDLAGRGGVQSATLDHVMGAVADMKPAPGQGCLVFATSHGVKDAGFYLSASDSPLSPLALDLALTVGCADAPTVVVVSACFSGMFAQSPMLRPNRIVLTAARPDRTSFGCRAGRIYTVYDECFLRAYDAAGTWREVFDVTKACVAAEEQREQVIPSEPQASFGLLVASLPIPKK